MHKSLRDFRPLRYSSRDGHAEGEHVNRGRDTPSFCPTLQVLDMSTLGDLADVNPVIKLLSHTYNVCGRNMRIFRRPSHLKQYKFMFFESYYEGGETKNFCFQPVIHITYVHTVFIHIHGRENCQIDCIVSVRFMPQNKQHPVVC